MADPPTTEEVPSNGGSGAGRGGGSGAGSGGTAATSGGSGGGSGGQVSQGGAQSGGQGGTAAGAAPVAGAAGAGGASGAGAAGAAGAAGHGAGAGGASGALGGAGSGGEAGVSGTSSGIGSAAGANGGIGGAAGSGGSGGNAGGTACTRAGAVICEDFENTTAGAVPSGWTKQGTIGASTNQAHGGTKSLEVGAATSGPRRMRLTGGAVAALGGTHWGRIFYKVETPAPVPSSGVIHSTIVAGEATSPLGGNIEVRVVDTVENTDGDHQYLYNVQPSGRNEFGKGSSYDYQYDGAWHCAEWYVDHETQGYRFFVDGGEVQQIAIMNGAGNYQNSEVPAEFASIAVGWYNYQQAPDSGFVAWIDDVALGPNRIGCD